MRLTYVVMGDQAKESLKVLKLLSRKHLREAISGHLFSGQIFDRNLFPSSIPVESIYAGY